MTLDNSLINDTFMYPYAMEYNAPLTPVYNYNYSCNNNNNSRMVSSWDIFKTFLDETSSQNVENENFWGNDNNKT